MRLKVIPLFAFWVVTGFETFAESPASMDPERPNILLILADDLGWSDIGCYGGEIRTPNLDRLAENGIRFRQFRNTAKCMTSRASLLTGLYAQQCEMMLPKEIKNGVTLGEVLRSAGYRTLWVGKHHGTENPFHRGFDRYYGLKEGACNHFNPGLQRPGEGKPARKGWDRPWCIDGETILPFTPEDKDFYTTDAFTDYALKYLDEYKAEEKPFFLYVSYTAPHDPLMAWPEDIARYESVYEVGYESIRAARLERQREMGLIDDRYTLSEPAYAQWEHLTAEEKRDEIRRMQVYAAMVDSMDQNIGRILDKLEELDKLENTLILFASDNGASAEVVNPEERENIPGTGEIGSLTRWSSQRKDWANVSNTPFRNFKNYSHEGGINTPLIAYWPKGIKNSGRFSDFSGHFIDIMPTVLELTGASYPNSHAGKPVLQLEGTSLQPVFEGEYKDRVAPIFWEWGKGRAVVNGPWKLVSHADDNEKPVQWELYNIEADRTETSDLSRAYPEVVQQLSMLFNQWSMRVKP